MSDARGDDVGRPRRRRARRLPSAVAADGYRPDMILGIARGGLLVAGALGYALGVKNTFTMNVEFYTGIDERLEMPMILPPVPDLVDFDETRVLIADDVADTGATLKLVQEFCAGKVAEVRCAVLYEKPRSTVNCEYVWRRTDRWITFPWSADEPVLQARSCSLVIRAPSVMVDRTPPEHPAPEERSDIDQEEARARRGHFGDRGCRRRPGAGHLARLGEVDRRIQGRLDLRRPAQRRRLVAGARQRPARTSRRRSARRCRPPTRRTSPAGPQFDQTVSSLLVRDGLQDHLRDLVRLPATMQVAAKYPNVLFEQATGTDVAKNLAEYFGAAEDTVYLSGMAAGAAAKCSTIGLRRRVPDPRGDPPRERVRARRAADAPGHQGEARLDELVVRPGEGEEGRAEPARLRRRVLGQNVDSPAAGQYAESVGAPWVGYDSDASKFAPKSWLTASVYNWGQYYLRRRQRGA